ncbi:MAG: hypothetical protein II290_06265 [Oscillospiraceae bacterium]|nr:hypothetical protein [Oscillospiraceae bacterium]
MKKYMVRSWMAFVLVLMLVPSFMADTVSASAQARETAVPRTTSDDVGFSLYMSASVSVEDPSVIDVVVGVRDIRQALDAVEFVLHFDETLVEGIITENGDAMDAFVTVAPMYTVAIAGMEIPASRYEQICAYHADTGDYACRFVDSLRYPNAKPGEKYEGLINDGDLVITIPFRIVDLPAKGHGIEFSITDALGTTRSDLLCVRGVGDSARVDIIRPEDPVTTLPTDAPSIGETVVDPVDTVPTEGTGDTGDTGLTEPAPQETGTTAPTETTGGAEATVPPGPTEQTGSGEDSVPETSGDGTVPTDPVSGGDDGPEEPTATVPQTHTQSEQPSQPAGEATEGDTPTAPAPKVSASVAVAVAVLVGATAVLVWKLSGKKRQR